VLWDTVEVTRRSDATWSRERILDALVESDMRLGHTLMEETVAE
jgi:hypothetical protein